LWYFFGIVIAFGIFAGIAGLGIGYVAGVLWEQIHRHRRRERLKAKATLETEAPELTTIDANPPRLQLVSVDAPDLPEIVGKVLSSVRFYSRSIQLELAGIRLELTGNPLIICGGVRVRYPEPGSRDTLCALIGDRIQSVNTPSLERMEISFASGCELVIARNAIAVA
jgi:hypothetical protein